MRAALPFRSESSPFSLSARRADKEIAISWNSQLPAISEARIGVVTIKDGNSQTEIPLTRAQLQISKLIYAYRNNRLEITLEVFSAAGRPLRESIMLALAGQDIRARAVPERLQDLRQLER